MAGRLGVVAAAVVVVLGLVAPTGVSAEVDTTYGTDYRAISISGSYQMLEGQFAGDAATDLLFYGPGSAPDSLWIGKTGGRGANGFTKVPLSISGTYVPVVGDFGGDDYSDVLFYGRGSAADSLWISVDTSAYFSHKTVSISGANYQPKVLLDGRGLGAKDDVLFLGPGNVADYLWHFTEQVGTDDYVGPGTWVSRTLRVNGAYQLVVGDWSGDHLDDVVLYQPGTAADYQWVSKTTGLFTETKITVNGTYQPVTVRHEQFDGIYWWASGPANEIYWNSNGTSFAGKPVVQYPTLRGIAGPYGADGLIIRSDNERDGQVWAQASKADTYFLANANHDFGTAWKYSVGDFDNDGWLDLLWYGPGTRKDEAWYAIAQGGTAKSAPGAEARVQQVTPFAER